MHASRKLHIYVSFLYIGRFYYLMTGASLLFIRFYNTILPSICWDMTAVGDWLAWLLRIADMDTLFLFLHSIYLLSLACWGITLRRYFLLLTEDDDWASFPRLMVSLPVFKKQISQPRHCLHYLSATYASIRKRHRLLRVVLVDILKYWYRRGYILIGFHITSQITYSAKKSIFHICLIISVVCFITISSRLRQ